MVSHGGFVSLYFNHGGYSVCIGPFVFSRRIEGEIRSLFVLRRM